ncbi:MAG TPA: hypothetical protein VHR66_16110 [Gemmataceae bacterium]|nr:hypothetical protein [Gemmataceae bacterium]
MRPILTLTVLSLLAGSADACPWTFRCCRPRPVVVCPQPVESMPVVEEKKPEPERKDLAPDGWCHIHGRIVLDGEPIPKQKLIPMSGGAYTENWVVNATNRGVKNVVVWLVPELSKEQIEALEKRRLREVPSFKPEQVYPDLSLKGARSLIHGEPKRAYVPHVTAAQAGSDLYIQNLSQVADNPKWSSLENGEFGTLVAPGRDREVKGLKVERFPIVIDSAIYPWMRAYVWVFDHPYFAVTDPDGNFKFRFAPKGNLRLVVWQEDMGFKNGREGRWGEAIQVPSGWLELGEIKIKERK